MERSTVGSLLRSTQAFCSQVCDKETLEYGIAYYSERFPLLPEANQYREVIVDDPANFPAALQESQRWFRERGLRCHRWAPAMGEPNPELAGFLEQHGFLPRTLTAMTLTRWPDVTPPANVRVLHARAVRAAYRTTFVDQPPPILAAVPDTPAIRAQLAEAYEERLDDPSFDGFVALVDNQPTGRCTLYQVGDIARVIDFEVHPDFLGHGIDMALTAHALALAKRLAMRNICVQVDQTSTDRIGFLQQAGFVADGEIIEFEHQGGHVGPSE